METNATPSGGSTAPRNTAAGAAVPRSSATPAPASSSSPASANTSADNIMPEGDAPHVVRDAFQRPPAPVMSRAQRVERDETLKRRLTPDQYAAYVAERDAREAAEQAATDTEAKSATGGTGAPNPGGGSSMPASSSGTTSAAPAAPSAGTMAAPSGTMAAPAGTIAR